MTTAVDTSVLLDLLARESEHQVAAATALARARKNGSIVICEVVYAELAAAFKGDREKVNAFLRDAGITIARSTEEALGNAGGLWQSYRDRGSPRVRIFPDFLVGGHALTQANELLTRDRGFFREGFRKLRVVDPSKA